MWLMMISVSATTEMAAEIGVEEERDELELYLMEKVKNPKTLLGTQYDVFFVKA